jgi:hypothetical protein
MIDREHFGVRRPCAAFPVEAASSAEANAASCVAPSPTALAVSSPIEPAATNQIKVAQRRGSFRRYCCRA